MLKHYEKSVDTFTRDDINQNQFDALVSFIFNTGEGGIVNTNVQKAVNSGNFADVPAKLLEWSKARINGVLQVNKGLYNRRLSEGQLFAKDSSTAVTPAVTMVAWTKQSLTEAQTKLATLGLYTVKVDGLWGPSTAAAVSKFAADKKIDLGPDPKKQVPQALLESLKAV